MITIALLNIARSALQELTSARTRGDALRMRAAPLCGYRIEAMFEAATTI
jgi:hypothetical protein